MKILKYKKLKQNVYQVDFDTESVILYDDVILEYNLLLRKSISSMELEEIKKKNMELSGFYVSLKWISRKMRTRKEVSDYLTKQGFDMDTISKTLLKLEQNGYLDDKKYIDAYVNDTIKFKNDGPKKILDNLEKLGLQKEDIDKKLEQIDESVWQEKIKKILEKKILSNHKESASSLKRKLSNYLIVQGYSYSQVEKELERITIKQDETIILKEKEKLMRKLSRKYDGNALYFQLKNKLYQKGFTKEEIESVLSNE